MMASPAAEKGGLKNRATSKATSRVGSKALRRAICALTPITEVNHCLLDFILSLEQMRSIYNYFILLVHREASIRRSRRRS